MPSYRPPSGKNIIFSFSEAGYSAPDFLNINFADAPYSTSDLQAAITVSQYYDKGSADLSANLEVWPLFQDATYTYIKSCRKIVIGYSDEGIQTIELPCLFGGIRDLGLTVVGIKRGFVDLGAELFGATDIYADVLANIRSLHKDSYDLNAGAYAIAPYDIAALLNVIEIFNLPGYITGELFKGYKDLLTTFGRVTLKSRVNINAFISGIDFKDLLGYLNVSYITDLSAFILAGNFKIQKNLAAFLSCVSPVDLQANLHGYAAANLNAFTIVGYQPYDLPANILAVRPRDLPAYVYGMQNQKEHYDLVAHVLGLATFDLPSYIYAMGSAFFYAYVIATGKYLDLAAEIVPKTINIKRIISVSLYEHKDLKATMNYNCLRSSYVNLSAYVYTIKKLDLGAFIIGWFGGKADNVIDLAAYINVADYLHTNYTSCTSTVYSYTPAFVTHNIASSPKKATYKVINTMMFLGAQSTNILKATITGILYSYDLKGYIVAKPLANFTTVPSWVNPKTLEVVINLDRFEERWRRFVEMMFFTNSESDYHFFYVPGDNNVYKVDRKRTWKIQVTGFSADTENIYSRIKLKKLFVFNLSNYSTFDEALSDLIDRVSMSRKIDLAAYVTTFTYPSTNLSAEISVKKIRRWSKALIAIIKGSLNSYKLLPATIVPDQYHDLNNLTALIVGKGYEPPTASGILFNFKNTYVSPGSYNNMNWTNLQAEDFWKGN